MANVLFIKANSRPIEQAVSEQGLTAFMDPFVAAHPSVLRPPLIWLFWSSTRSGNSDVYFQTIAPHIAPVASNP